MHRLHAYSIQNPQKILSYKKRSIFQPIIFFLQIVFSGASVWSREYINRASGGHTSRWIHRHCWECHPTTLSDQIKATTCCRPDNCPSAGLDILFTCLFRLTSWKFLFKNLLIFFVYLYGNNGLVLKNEKEKFNQTFPVQAKLYKWRVVALVNS